MLDSFRPASRVRLPFGDGVPPPPSDDEPRPSTSPANSSTTLPQQKALRPRRTSDELAEQRAGYYVARSRPRSKRRPHTPPGSARDGATFLERVEARGRGSTDDSQRSLSPGDSSATLGNEGTASSRGSQVDESFSRLSTGAPTEAVGRRLTDRAPRANGRSKKALDQFANLSRVPAPADRKGQHEALEREARSFKFQPLTGPRPAARSHGSRGFERPRIP